MVYDDDAIGRSSFPWLRRHRNYLAFGPNPATDQLVYFRANRRRKFPRKYTTPGHAIAAIDKRFPLPRRTPPQQGKANDRKQRQTPRHAKKTSARGRKAAKPKECASELPFGT